MTTIHRWWLACNACQAFIDNSAIPAAKTKSEVVAEARRKGWLIGQLDIHLCPECRRPEGAKSAQTQKTRKVPRGRAR